MENYLLAEILRTVEPDRVSRLALVLEWPDEADNFKQKRTKGRLMGKATQVCHMLPREFLSL